MSTPILPFAVWASGTNQNSVPANDNSLRHEILNGLVISASTDAQPGSPADGDIYIMTGAASGAQWATFDEFDLVIYKGGTWYAFAPVEGIVVNLAGTLYRWDGAAYLSVSGGGFATVAIQYTADLGSTADSDPGAGLLKWNHATQGSATQLFLDDTTADGVSLTGIWAALAAGGFVYLQHATDQDLWQIWEVTGVVDAAGYAKLTVALAAKSTANFADADSMLVTIQQGASSSAVADGTYGDITVSGTGTVWTIANNAVTTAKVINGAITLAKQADVATGTVFYRKTAGTGAPEVQTLATLAADLGVDTRGKQEIYILANSMVLQTTGNIAARGQVATASGQPDIVSLDFDPTTQENAIFAFVPPKKWNAGTITFRAHWSHAATTTNFGVAIGLQAVAASDDDTIAVNYGTGIVVTDTGGTTNDLYTTAESAAVTIDGSPAKGDMVFFRVFRQTANGADTMTIDMRLMGITLYFTTDASTDA